MPNEMYACHPIDSNYQLVAFKISLEINRAELKSSMYLESTILPLYTMCYNACLSQDDNII